MRGRGLCALVAALVATSAAAIGVAATSAGAAQDAHKTLVQQGLSFYRGKSISWVVGGSIGGGGQVFALTLAPVMATFLHAQINVEAIPAGGGVTGADEANAAAGDGLTIGLMQTGYASSTELSGVQYVNFNMLHDGWIEAEQVGAQVWVASPSSGISSLSSLLSQSSSTNERVCQPFQGTPSWLESRALNTLLGTHLNVLTGYSTLAAIVQGYTRGDCPIGEAGPAQVGPLMAGNQATGLMTTITLAKGEAYGHYVNALPTFAKIFAQHPGTTNLEKAQIKALLSYVQAPSELMFTPTSVSPAKLAALRAAAKFALSNSTVKQTLLTDGQNPMYSDPVADKAAFVNDLPKWKVLSCYAGSATTCSA